MMLSSLSLALTSLERRRGGATFDPANLFGVNDRGGIYDLTTSANLKQLSGGTTDVSVGDPVGYVADLGPIVRPALQATAASRPVCAGVPRALGAELVSNGRFATDTDWSKGTGWSINTATGRAEKTAGTASVLSIPVSVTPGKFYFLPFYITRTAGAITARLTGGTTVAGAARSYVGSYLEVFQALTGNVMLEFSADASFAGSVGNVSLREVTSYTNMGARFDQVDDFLQSASVDLSNSNKATMVVSFQQGQSALTQAVAEFGSYNANVTGSFHTLQNAGWSGRVRGASAAAESKPPAAEAHIANTYHSNVVSTIVDLAGATIADQVKVRSRGVLATQTTGGTSVGGGNIANGALTLGRSFNSVWRFGGIIHRALVINRQLSAEELDQAEKWCRAGMVYAAQLGDSTVARLDSSAAMPQALPVNSLVGGMICGAADVSKAGDRISDQKTAWINLANKQALQAVFVQIGLNDVKGRVGSNLATAEQVIADLQDLINTVNASKPAGCKVYISGLIPCKAWLDAASNPSAAYAAWQAVNEAIAGNGATPITGVDGRITSHVTALAGAGDILDPKYDMDGVHENNEARFIIAQAWRTQLEADGLV